MLDRTKPMYLGDIFNTSIQLIKETFLRNLVIASAFFVPAGFIMAYGFDYFFSQIIDSVEASAGGAISTSYSPEYEGIFAGFFIYAIVIAVLLFCTLVVTIGVTYVAKMQINGNRISLSEAFKKIFSITFFQTIGQSILLGLILSGIIGIPVVILIISGAAKLPLLAVIGVLLLLASFFIAMYFYIKWYFAFTAIVCDDTNVFESFNQSSFLVKNYWWRTFGLVILISITVQFAISIITTPISFIVMWDFFAEYFKMMAGGNFNRNDPSQILSMFSSFGFGLGIIITISSILQYIIAPVFNVTLYYDLKIRKKDFNDIDIITQDGTQPVV